MAARLIQHDQRLPLYVCCFCGIHIALHSDYAWLDSRNDKAIFLDVVNVQTYGYYRDGDNILADLYCSGCSNILGIKFIDVGNNNLRCVRAGRFELNMTKLLFWDGNLTHQYVRRSPLFLCRICGNRFALNTFFVCLNTIIGKAIFPNGLNLRQDYHWYNRREDGNRVANVRCARCNNILGIKFILVRNNHNHSCVIAGRFELNMTKVLFWDGNFMYQFPLIPPV